MQVLRKFKAFCLAHKKVPQAIQKCVLFFLVAKLLYKNSVHSSVKISGENMSAVIQDIVGFCF